MFRELQRLVKLETGKSNIETETAAVSHRKFLYKESYTKWQCSECQHAYYYQMFRCPLCESKGIEETVIQIMK